MAYALTGVAKQWAREPELLARLNAHGRLFVSKDEEELSTTNGQVAHNHRALRPLLEIVAEQPAWELFHLSSVKNEFPDCICCQTSALFLLSW